MTREQFDLAAWAAMNAVARGAANTGNARGAWEHDGTNEEVVEHAELERLMDESFDASRDTADADAANAAGAAGAAGVSAVPAVPAISAGPGTGTVGVASEAGATGARGARDAARIDGVTDAGAAASSADTLSVAGTCGAVASSADTDGVAGVVGADTAAGVSSDRCGEASPAERKRMRREALELITPWMKERGELPSQAGGVQGWCAETLVSASAKPAGHVVY